MIPFAFKYNNTAHFIIACILVILTAKQHQHYLPSAKYLNKNFIL